MTKLSLNKVETFIKGLDENPELKQEFDTVPKVNQFTNQQLFKMKKFIITIALSISTFFAYSQGCETILMNGVFNTFNVYSGSYSSAEWHNFWCNGTVERTSSNSSTGVSLNVVVAKIPIGMSYDDAKEFQRIYQSTNCGSNAGGTQNFSTNTVIQKVASPEILKAYVDCKKLQSSGLIVDMSIRPDDKKVFVVDVKYTGAWPSGTGPKVKKVSFLPNLISIREGTLQDGVELKSGQTFSMICERSAEYPVTIYVETEVGTFHADLSPTIPPPTDQEKIMTAMPRGTIVGWYDPNKVPKGWALCDGKNGTPNLDDRFPIGSINTTDLGTSIGNPTHTHNISGTTNIPNSLTEYSGDNSALQKDGHERVHHVHNFSVTSGDGSSIPPATKIMFIMKI